MKSIVKILTCGLVSVTLVLVSCQKEETENDLRIEKSQEEGFFSKTGNNDSELDTSSEILIPLLHKQYDASLSREDVEASFEADVSKFMKEESKANRPRSYVYIQVATRTGTYSHSESDANIWARVNFLTDKGSHLPPWFKLDDPIRNDFENGAWDFFYFGVHISSINWVEVENATLALQGTDGWYVQWFDVHLKNDSRYEGAASGRSDIYSNPQSWMDNSTSSGWDFHSTGNVGRGRLTFN